MNLLRSKPVLVSLAILCLAGVGVFCYNASRVGKVLDSYRSVSVYDNGLLYFRSYGKHYAQDGFYYGQKWQCVEFIKRFFHDAKQHKMPDGMGHAKSFFDQTLDDGAVNSRRGLVQYRNGSTHGPQPDDLIVFTDTKFGHVAIVTQLATNSVEIIQQNILAGPRRRFSLVVSNGQYFVTSPRIPAGWLRQYRLQHAVLHATTELRQMAVPPGNRLEALKGDRKGQAVRPQP
ncbi:MAG: CHAP domain-containing protein [Verrucomicrobiota bacterium]